MRMISGSFNGTGSAINLGLGIAPDFVRVVNTAERIQVEWNRHMLDGADACKGGVKTVADGTRTILTAGNGIEPYAGAETAGSSNTDKLVYDPDNDDYTFAAADEGVELPQGFTLNDTDVCADGDVCVFEAGFYDN